MRRDVIVKLESFDGRDTFLHCGNDTQNFLYCIVEVLDNGSTAVIDSGYRTYEEAAAAWPEAAVKRKPRDR